MFDNYALTTYSQEGEDVILRRIFDGQRQGFYVDVGAHHPRRFSNTYDFYRRGWSGVNIEPNPQAMRALTRERKRDVNLQIGVADCGGKLIYHRFDDPALNTFDEGLARWRAENTPYKLLGSIEVPVERLDAILPRYLAPDQPIDFMSIDAEGFDLAVLRSNDWIRFRPRCVLVEALGTSVASAMRTEVATFMAEHGYELFSKLYSTLLFRDTNSGHGTSGTTGVI